MPVIRQLEATRGPRAPHETTDDLGQRATALAEFRMISLLRQQDMQEMHGYRLGLDLMFAGVEMVCPPFLFPTVLQEPPWQNQGLPRFMWFSLDRISSENSCQACKICFARTCGAYKI